LSATFDVGDPTATLWVPAPDEIDRAALRAERLARLQQVMRERGVPVCVLFVPANIRYATGTATMYVWGTTTTNRYCVVPADRPPVLFEQELAIAQASKMLDDVRVGHWWQFHGDQAHDRVRVFAAELFDLLQELGLADGPIAVDRLDALGFLSLQAAGLRLTEALTTLEAAREIKTLEEIKLLALNGAIGDAAMAEFEQAIRPGIAEYELFAALSDGILRRHGELVFTRLVASGRNTNPWGSEAHGKLVQPGDLVAVDTDAFGYEGYLIDFSRTFHCGQRPSREQIELYRVAHDYLSAMREAAQPGLSYRQFAEAVPELPQRYRARRYDIMVHGGGLEDEGPTIYYPGQDENPDDAYLQAGMCLCLECYIGEEDGPFGVKLEDQVLLTDAGSELLSTYPFDAGLLGLQ
jgi:Xaa-Pro aminopeptidase